MNNFGIFGTMSAPSESSDSGSDRNGLCIRILYIRPFAGEVSSTFEVLLFKKFHAFVLLQLKHDEILSYFSAFGDVSDVRIRSKPKCSFGFVKFTLPESAAKVLGVDLHVIDGRRVKIVAASDRHQDDIFLLDIDDITTKLLDMNDECVLEILSVKCLSVVDLCAIAETCRRLKEIASLVFRRKHRTCDLDSLRGVNAKTAKRILMNFGSVIRHLNISGFKEQEWQRKVMDSVMEYCSNATLKSLSLGYFKFPENTPAKLGTLFRKLRILNIHFCTFEGTSRKLFADCASLAKLCIKQSAYGSEPAFIFENTFPKLKKFNCYYEADSDSLRTFISRHKNLLSLRILNDVESSILQVIANCKRLETLKCRIDPNATLDLSNLGHLRKLEIDAKRRNVTKAAQGLNNLQFLEHLILLDAEIDSEFIGTLAQLKRLQKFYVSKCFGLQNLNRLGNLNQLTSLDIFSTENVDLDIVILVKRLSNLNSLKVHVAAFRMDLRMYLSIVDIVRRRADRSKLVFRITCNDLRDYDHLCDDFARNAGIVEMIIERYWSHF